MVLFWIREKNKDKTRPPKHFDVLHIDKVTGCYLISDTRTGEFSIIMDYAELKNNYVREKRRSG